MAKTLEHCWRQLKLIRVTLLGDAKDVIGMHIPCWWEYKIINHFGKYLAVS